MSFWQGDGKGDGSWEALLLLGLIGACLRLQCPTQSPQAGTWQKGEEERSFNRLVLSFDEGKTHMGQASGSRCWWRTCQDCVEGQGSDGCVT